MEDEPQLNPEEEAQLEELIKAYGSPTAEEKHTVHTFLDNVRKSKDTIKTGNLTEEELGMADLPVRTLKELELIADKLCCNNVMSEFFHEEAEILTATSLSKNAKLINLAVVTRKEITDPFNRPKKKNLGWFKKKEESSSEPLGQL